MEIKTVNFYLSLGNCKNKEKTFFHNANIGLTYELLWKLLHLRFDEKLRILYFNVNYLKFDNYEYDKLSFLLYFSSILFFKEEKRGNRTIY